MSFVTLATISTSAIHAKTLWITGLIFLPGICALAAFLRLWHGSLQSKLQALNEQILEVNRHLEALLHGSVSQAQPFTDGLGPSHWQLMNSLYEWAERERPPRTTLINVVRLAQRQHDVILAVTEQIPRLLRAPWRFPMAALLLRKYRHKLRNLQRCAKAHCTKPRTQHAGEQYRQVFDLCREQLKALIPGGGFTVKYQGPSYLLEDEARDDFPCSWDPTEGEEMCRDAAEVLAFIGRRLPFLSRSEDRFYLLLEYDGLADCPRQAIPFDDVKPEHLHQPGWTITVESFTNDGYLQTWLKTGKAKWTENLDDWPASFDIEPKTAGFVIDTLLQPVEKFLFHGSTVGAQF